MRDLKRLGDSTYNKLLHHEKRCSICKNCSKSCPAGEKLRLTYLSINKSISRLEDRDYG